MPSALTEQHLAVQRNITAETMRLLAVAWRTLDGNDLDGSFARYVAAVLPTVTQNRAASIAAAVLYLTEQRTEVLGDPGVILAAAQAPPEQVLTVARVTGPVTVKRAMSAGIGLSEAMTAAYVLSSGDLARLVQGGGRDTIINSAIAEPRVVGWRRVLSAPSCKFCQMLAGRGEVYTEATVRFRAHGHCDCGAEEVYGDSTVGRRSGAQGDYVRGAVRDESERVARNARAREWIRANGV